LFANYKNITAVQVQQEDSVFSLAAIGSGGELEAIRDVDLSKV
jgi:hypothetical protein